MVYTPRNNVLNMSDPHIGECDPWEIGSDTLLPESLTQRVHIHYPYGINRPFYGFLGGLIP